MLKGTGKVKLVRIAHRVSDVRNRQGRHLQKFPRLGHAVGDQKLLGRYPYGVPEDLSKVAPVQITESGNVLH